MANYLPELLALITNTKVRGNPAITIEHIAYDSRRVQPNSLFICLAGNTVDGHDFAIKAVEKGAIAILVEREVAVPHGVVVITTPDTRLAMQAIVPCFFDYPARKLAYDRGHWHEWQNDNHLPASLHFARSQLSSRLIGTIQSLIEDHVLSVKNTTPDVVDLQELLWKMVDAKIDYVVMEVSSHALALGRVDGCEFDVGVFTNLTQDHLDYHKTFENYIQAKAKLFSMLSQPNQTKQHKTAVVNLDAVASEVMLKHANCSAITYSIENPKADIRASHIDIASKASTFVITGPFGSQALNLRITGDFNIYNSMAAISAAIAEEIPFATIVHAIENAKSVPGRFELVDEGQPFSVIVDYAHTPDGLENILKTVRQFAKQKVIVVFGCGGDRDRSKRPIMGRLAAEYADVVIATSDNPRSEDPDAILHEVEQGIRTAIRPGARYEVLVDRREAIKKALATAQAEDVVVIAGKGHETYQVLRDKVIDFDDREIVREIVREMK